MPRKSRIRRVAAVGIAATAVLTLVAGCSADAGSTESSASSDLSGNIIWADYGGPTNESRQVAYFDSFYDETGVEVVSTSIEDAIYLGILDGDSPDYDIFQAGASDVLPDTSNVLEIPESAQGDLLPENMQPYYIGGFIFGEAQGWLTDTFPDGGPQDWVDFFDTDKFPGKRAWPGSPGSFDASYEIALLADGVAAEDLYPLDIERATAKLDTIRDDLVFYQSYPEAQQLLTSGSVAIAVTVTGQFQALINAGEDVTVQWNEAFAVPSGFVASNQVENTDEVIALAEWMNDPERQAVFTERTGYGPSNSAVFDYLSEDVQGNIVNSPDHTNLIYWDDEWRGANYEDLVNSYTDWLAG
ncbi:putative spermidine/putrescine transport system substrate-binding protein [Microbacterium endophyticum]|uniref:Putative spermidine/putrescine transport system substrate-binding protein n=1 Tax=Microbacterium endophyticum TaxID=1526412 RepID=A0A7W4V256_9MICO|nr:extracellular solute-binding protein [Microbacterium endophyticum]MBB2975359.1 putative spermidine/putrescine transport system substrate-binding protein [Microbacterium endophyticum]NIK35622.1 putative spermidine/putrescine transport system substrate-binding protein [Microbacterium endophyticum]